MERGNIEMQVSSKFQENRKLPPSSPQQQSCSKTMQFFLSISTIINGILNKMYPFYVVHVPDHIIVLFSL